MNENFGRSRHSSLFIALEATKHKNNTRTNKQQEQLITTQQPHQDDGYVRQKEGAGVHTPSLPP